MLKPELTLAQVDLIADLLTIRVPARTAAKLVLHERLAIIDAAKQTGLHPSSVSRTIKRYRETHEKIQAAYGSRLTRLKTDL